MCKQLSSKLSVVGIGKTLRTGSKLMLICLILGVTGTANAVPVPPLPGYLPDTGTTYFTPSAAAVGIELVDPLEPFTSFGFFYQGDSSTLIDIFDSGDIVGGDPLANPQVSLVDFANGLIFDLDIAPPTPTLESSFTVMAEDIGFFLNVGPTTIYSDPLLNGGLDLFSAWRNELDPTLWGLAFEGQNPDGSLAVINITLVGGIAAAAPEPSIMALLALGWSLLLVVGSLRRRKVG